MEEKEHMETIENLSTNERALRTASRLLSVVFPPFMVPSVAILLLFLFTFLAYMPLIYKVIIIGTVYFFTVIVPMLSIYLYQRFCGKGIQELKEKEKRFIPYALTAISYCTCAIILYRLYAPLYLSAIVIATIFCMLLCGGINLKWKISTHTASCGMLTGGLLSYSVIFHFNPLGWLCGFILLSGLIGTARMILKQHSLLEVIIGFVVGMFCGIIGIMFI